MIQELSQLSLPTLVDIRALRPYTNNLLKQLAPFLSLYCIWCFLWKYLTLHSLVRLCSKIIQHTVFFCI